MSIANVSPVSVAFRMKKASESAPLAIRSALMSEADVIQEGVYALAAGELRGESLKRFEARVSESVKMLKAWGLM